MHPPIICSFVFGSFCRSFLPRQEHRWWRRRMHEVTFSRVVPLARGLRIRILPGSHFLKSCSFGQRLEDSNLEWYLTLFLEDAILGGRVVESLR